MSTKQSLFPRHTRVDDFGPDEDYEDGEEASYVTLDLGGTEPTLVPNSSSYRLIGLDTPTPYLQLSGTILKGTHDNLLGTELLFANSECESPSSSTVSHLANTSQRISFRAVQLRKKDATPAPTKRKGKGRGEGVIDLTDDRVVERMTGKLPKERRKRGSKKKGDEANEEEVADAEGGDGDVAEASAPKPKRRTPARRASTRGKESGGSKGKGKTRAEESDSDDDDEWVGDD
ncbi:hypothetical protein EV715DRAFT_213309 [Schizophyllum commune]